MYNYVSVSVVIRCPRGHSTCAQIDAVKIDPDRVLNLNVAHQQPPEGRVLSMLIWRRLDSEELGNQYTTVVSFCSN